MEIKPEMSYKNLFTALAKAQGEFTIAKKSSKNPFFKSNYAGIEEMVAATRPALEKYGLSVTQEQAWVDGILFCRTVLGHSSGEFRPSMWPIMPVKNDIQSIGSYYSYVCRYAYKSITGVVTGDDDDDGEAAMPRQEYQPDRSYQQSHTTYINANDPITAEQIEVIETELENHQDILKTMMDSLKVTNLSQIKKSQFKSIVARIQTIKGNKVS